MCHMEPPSTEAAGRIIQLWQVSSISVSNEALSRTLPMQRLHCHDPHAQKPHNSGTRKILDLSYKKHGQGWPPKKFQQNMESNSLFAAAFPKFRDRKNKHRHQPNTWQCSKPLVVQWGSSAPNLGCPLTSLLTRRYSRIAWICWAETPGKSALATPWLD